MDAFQLKMLQDPLKEKYRVQPETALVTLKATAHAGEGITCNIQTGKVLAQVGLHPASGGDGFSLCSGDMLLEALAACAGVTLKAVATATGFDLKDAIIYTEGELDFRGTFSVDKNVAVGFQSIRVVFKLETEEPKEKIVKLIRLTERYCVVYQTLLQSNIINVAVEEDKN